MARIAVAVKNTFIDDYVKESSEPFSLAACKAVTTPAGYASGCTTGPDDVEATPDVPSSTTIVPDDELVCPFDNFEFCAGDKFCTSCARSREEILSFLSARVQLPTEMLDSEVEQPEEGATAVSSKQACFCDYKTEDPFEDGPTPMSAKPRFCDYKTEDPFEAVAMLAEPAYIVLSNDPGYAAPDAKLPVASGNDSAGAAAPAQLKLGKPGLRVESVANGRQLIQWRTKSEKVKPKFGQHLSPRIECSINGSPCQFMITLKETNAEDARRERRNQEETSCNIEIKLLSGLEGHSNGILTYSVSLGSGAKQTQPRYELHDFKTATTSSPGQKDSCGRTEWNHMEAVDKANKTLDVWLEFLL